MVVVKCCWCIVRSLLVLNAEADPNSLEAATQKGCQEELTNMRYLAACTENRRKDLLELASCGFQKIAFFLWIRYKYIVGKKWWQLFMWQGKLIGQWKSLLKWNTECLKPADAFFFSRMLLFSEVVQRQWQKVLLDRNRYLESWT